MSEQQLDVYTYADMKGASFKIGSYGQEWISRCIVPGCSSQHDAFSVQPEGKGTGRWAGYGAWMCRKCWDPSEMITVEYGLERGRRRKRGWGTIADLVMACENMTYQQAVQFIKEHEGAPVPMASRPKLIGRKTDEQWIAESKEYLRQSYDPSRADLDLVLNYLASRGLSVETAHRLGFGYSLDQVKLQDDTYREIPFLVIPWYKDKAAGTLYRKINRRNLHTPLPGDESKYRTRAGSDNDALYLGETLREQKRPTFLVESELDAATVLQEAGDLVQVVATGTSQGGRNAMNEALLRRQPFVFVAFDADEAGEEASSYWLSKLDREKCMRYPPLMHDVNEMHTTHGLSVRKWVESGLLYYIPAQETKLLQDVRAYLQSAVTSQAACAICGGPVYRACHAGVAYCAEHWPYEGDEPVQAGDTCCKCGELASHASPGGNTYCTAHYQCIRGHALAWRYHDQMGTWICACFWEHQVPAPPETREQPEVRKCEPIPQVLCKFCGISTWIWSSYAGGMICIRCLSDAPIQSMSKESSWEN